MAKSARLVARPEKTQNLDEFRFSRFITSKVTINLGLNQKSLINQCFPRQIVLRQMIDDLFEELQWGAESEREKKKAIRVN
jgi:hypothetical protein